MSKSALVDAIREDYLQAAHSVPGGVVDHFCEFMVDWLAKKSVIGVGHAASGLALRFADGSELGLFNADFAPTTADTPAVSLTKGGVSARQGIGGADNSIRITGK